MQPALMYIQTHRPLSHSQKVQMNHTAEAVSRHHMPCLCRDALQGSTVQVGLQIRKGVGGTCPARAAARRPAMQSLLAALLTPAPLQHSSPATNPKETDPITARPPSPQPQKQLQQQLQHHQLPHQLHQQPQQQSPMCHSAPTALPTTPQLHHSPNPLLSSGYVASNNSATYSGLQTQLGLQQQQQQQQDLPSQTGSRPTLQQQSLQHPGPTLVSTSYEDSAATIAANSNDVCLNADRGTNEAAVSEESTVPAACSEDVEQPEVFGSFVEQLLDAAAWPEDSAATGMTGSLQLYKVQVWMVACQVDAVVDKFVICSEAANTDKLLQLMPQWLICLFTDKR